MQGRHIPERIRRAVREASAYCCVICGSLRCQYEHIEPYAKVRSHHAENIVLLCPACHSDVTGRRIAKSEVSAARASPYGKSGKGHPSYRLNLARQADIKFGGIEVAQVLRDENEVCLFYLPKGSYLTIKRRDGVPLFSGRVCNLRGESVLEIEENTITLRVGRFWDFRLEGREMQIWAGPKHILAKFVLEESQFFAERVRGLGVGCAIDVSEDAIHAFDNGGHITVHNMRYQGVFIRPNEVLALASPVNAAPLSFRIPVDQRWSTNILWNWLFKSKTIAGANHQTGGLCIADMEFVSVPFARLAAETDALAR